MWKIFLNQELISSNSSAVGARVGVTESHREPERDRERASTSQREPVRARGNQSEQRKPERAMVSQSESRRAHKPRQ